MSIFVLYVYNFFKKSQKPNIVKPNNTNMGNGTAFKNDINILAVNPLFFAISGFHVSIFVQFEIRYSCPRSPLIRIAVTTEQLEILNMVSPPTFSGDNMCCVFYPQTTRKEKRDFS